MWTVIIIAVIALIIIVTKSISEGDFIKGNHTHNFFMSMCCLMLTAVIALGATFATLFISIPIGVASDSLELVDTDNYYLAEVVNDKYINITSDTYSYATLENGVVHMRDIKAEDSTTITIVEDDTTKLSDSNKVLSNYKIVNKNISFIQRK